MRLVPPVRRNSRAPICLGLQVLIFSTAGCAEWRGGPAELGQAAACVGPSDVSQAAARNAASLYALRLTPFGREERGWAVYAPMVEHEVRTLCPADTAGFAAALARWQARRGLAGDGAMTPETFAAMKAGWQARRPFVRLRNQGICPDAPAPDQLAAVPAADKTDARPIELRTRALAAYRRMLRDARRAQPALAPDRLLIFSGYRSPAHDAARCAAERNCNGIVRAQCSAHRTGLALDLALDAAGGQALDSTADPNRLAMASGLAYRWLVANAGRYGFTPYAFEPWHWEWTGEAP